MIIDQNHSSDVSSVQKVIKHTGKITWLLKLDKQNVEVYNMPFGENRTLEKRLDDYYFQHKKLKKKVN